MEPKDSTMTSFYQMLGRVFYATAQADNHVHEKEVATLKQIVKDLWLDVEDATDEFSSDAAFQIEIVFDYLLENEIVVENVLEDLNEFKSIHTSLFTEKMSKLIMDTASKIAASFAQSNKSEVVFLSELWLVLKG
ncbi:MAG: hypothetical protein HWE22_10035 [Flavobacteriales bacterium]|nr:hypothetical protein [Flavobacteriales bacterium]